MIDNKKERMIELLRKLFALGQSPNQNEAEMAMAKANEIMTEYQISATDVDLADDGAVVREEMVLNDGRRHVWLQTLADAAAKLYDAKAFYNTHHCGPGLMLRFYGTPADILAAKMTFTHLYASWKSIVALAARTRDTDVRTYKRSHGIGFSSAIDVRVNELVAERQQKVISATGRDLVVVKGAALSDFMQGGKIKETRQSSRTDEYALHDGWSAGKSIPLHGALEKEHPLQITNGIAA